MEGWIKLHRCLKNKAIWKCSTAQQKVILITLLLMADHKGNEWEWKGNKYKTKPGQMITSVKSIIEEAGEDISRQNVRTALKKFEKYGFLTNESTKTGMLITIVNWGLYQAYINEGNQDTNHQLTISQPSANHQLTTNKNVRMKECKNDKEVVVRPSTTTEALEVFKYAEKCNFILSPLDREKIASDIEVFSLEEVMKALEIANDRGKRSYGYFRGILNSRRAGTNEKADKESEMNEALRKFVESDEYD